MEFGSVKTCGIKFNGTTPWTGFEIENAKKCIDKIPQNTDRPCSSWQVDSENDMPLWHRIKKQTSTLIPVCNKSGAGTASVNSKLK